MPQKRRVCATMVMGAALIWLGMLLGVSFIATPAKFLAPSLSLPVALDVGRQTFATFFVIELVVLGILLAAALVLLRAANVLTPLLICGVIVATQGLILLPDLDARVAAIIAGRTVPDSPFHAIYIGLEIVKVAALVWLAWAAYRNAVPTPFGPSNTTRGTRN